MIVELPIRLSCKIEETPTGQQRLIDTHWQIIAATAWAGYLDYGRGAVWLDPNNHCEPSLTEAGLGMRLWYCRQATLEESGLMRKPEIAEVVTTYTPEREIAVAMLLSDGSCSVDRYSSNGLLPDPAQAHALQMEVKPSFDTRLN